MPLNSLQQEIIANCIEDLLNIPFEEKPFLNEIEKLKCLFEPLFEFKEEGYSSLQQVLRNPERFLLNIEKFNPDITVGEVQIYILEVMTNELQKSATKLNLEFSTVQWNPETLLKPLRDNASFNESFKSVRPHPIEAQPYLIEPPDCIYKFFFIPQDEFIPELGIFRRTVLLITTINILPSIEKEITIDMQEVIRQLPRAQIYAQELDAKTNEFREGVTREAEKEISKIVIQNLIDHSAIPRHSNEICSLGATKLLFHPYFYKKLRDKKLEFKSIVSISEQQAKTLCTSNIISLLENNKISLEKLITLSPLTCDLLCIPYYNKLFANNKLDLKEIDILLKTQFKNLITPPAINLQLKEKITLDQAKKLSRPAKKIISNEYYYKLILQEELEFSQIEYITTAEQEILTTPSIIELIINKVITIESARKLPPHVGVILTNHPWILDLIYHQEIQLSDLAQIPHDFMYAASKMTLPSVKLTLQERLKLSALLKDFIKLSQHNLLCDSNLDLILQISAQLPEMEDATAYQNAFIKAKSIRSLCEKNLFKRFKAIIYNIPTKYNDGTIDSFAKLKKICEIFPFSFKKICSLLIEKQSLQYFCEGNGFFCKILTHSAELNLKPHDILTKVFNKRLLAWHDNTPYSIKNKSDTIELIKKDLRFLVNFSQINMDTLLSSVVKEYLQALQFDLLQSYTKLERMPLIYQQIFSAIDDTDNQPADKVLSDDWKTTFDKVIKIISDKHKSINNYSKEDIRINYSHPLRRTRSLFDLQQYIDPSKQIEMFCEKITAVTTLFMEPKPTLTPYSLNK